MAFAVFAYTFVRMLRRGFAVRFVVHASILAPYRDPCRPGDVNLTPGVYVSVVGARPV